MITPLEKLAAEVRHLTDRLPRHKSSRSEASSRAAKTRWSDPEYRALQSSLRKGRTFPRQAESIKRWWSNPENRANAIASFHKSEKRKASIIKAREALKQKRLDSKLQQLKVI